MLSYCADLVRKHSRDDLLLCLFMPAEAREAVLAVYALNIELAQVREKTSEELIGQVRLAWWQEAVEALYAGHPARDQPVLQALAPVIASGHPPRESVMALIENYRVHFPDSPPDIEAAMDEATLALLRALCPQAEAGWRKARNIILKHRRRHGQRRNGWLNFKLLVAGM
ncbi:MAG: squalene/phytoene synthase family protein [Pseudomonadota bacterium]|nr:squalene/phytoene synthase family protein [Pseudomonadota bacterium]MDE3037183.1 squalene/phytoene synthase family protein [Pseudomonadota bacterium]